MITGKRIPNFVKPIHIHDSCWLAADVFVSPGVEIVDGVIRSFIRSSVLRYFRKGVYKGNPLKKNKHE
jgi:acetyltransferase-like isoleucine patch superfamily enzyme